MLLTADRVLVNGEARAGIGLCVGADGRIQQIGSLAAMGRPDLELSGRVLMPGTVSAHSHTIERLLCGREQAGSSPGDLAGKQAAMDRILETIDADGLYATARHAFIELLAAGVTTVGECHTVHHRSDGSPYDDEAEMTDAVITAAGSSGIRLCLLRGVSLETRERRCCDPDIDVAAHRIGRAASRLLDRRDARLSWGISTRTLPPEAVVALKTRFSHVPMHIHVDGTTAPVEQLSQDGVLDGLTTLVDATGLTPDGLALLAETGAALCLSRSTGASLALLEAGVSLCVGAGRDADWSVLEKARDLDAQPRSSLEAASSVLEVATRQGACALNLQTGVLEPGRWADLVTLDLADASLAGWSDATLPALAACSADQRAVVDVVVSGIVVVSERQHPAAEESARDFAAASQRIVGSSLVATALPVSTGRRC